MTAKQLSRWLRAEAEKINRKPLRVDQTSGETIIAGWLMRKAEKIAAGRA